MDEQLRYIEKYNPMLNRIIKDIARVNKCLTPYEAGISFTIEADKLLVLIAGDPVKVFVNSLAWEEQIKYELTNKRRIGIDPNMGLVVKALREAVRVIPRFHHTLSNLNPPATAAYTIVKDDKTGIEKKKWIKGENKDAFILRVVQRDFEVTYNVTVKDKVSGHSLNFIASSKNLPDMLYDAQSRLGMMLTDWDSRVLKEQIEEVIEEIKEPTKATIELTDTNEIKTEIKYG